MNQPLVSVIVPTFNSREPAVSAVQSALAQSYQHHEVVVQDDGSTDGTTEAIATLNGPISYECQPQRGLAAARNNAIRRSRGELIALLEPRDTWTPDKLEKCVSWLMNHPQADIVYSSTRTADHQNDCLDGWVLAELFDRNFVHDSATVFHRQVWERIGGFDESLASSIGHSFWLRAAVGHRFGLIREPLVVGGPEDSPTAKAARIRAEMLFRFYEAQGGRERIERDRARYTIASAGRIAGRLALRDGDGTQAVRLLAGSLYYAPTLWTRVLYLAARLQRWWLKQPVYQESPLVFVTC
jgi:glycosyltransferase involved in cell wall biosynthesis